MDYQEAIEIFENEIKKLNTRPIHVNHIGDAEKAENAMKTAISAMQELNEYKQFGTPEEVREAVEKRSECKNCGYKIHSERISKLNNCNDCGLKNTCVKRPEYGECCRINCYDWRKMNEMS